MNKPLKIIKIGNSAGIILPKEILAKLRVSEGDELTMAKTDAGIELRPCEAHFEAQMVAARDVMTRRKRALRELAK